MSGNLSSIPSWRRQWHRAVGALIFAWFASCAQREATAQLPSSGPIVPELQPLENAMTNFMAPRAFLAGTLSLMKNSRLVFRQGYGWDDPARAEVIHPDRLFRLASVSKPITGTAVRTLINSGRLAAGTKVYSFLGIPPAGGVLGDARITNITVQHLLDHAAGWDRGVGPVFDPVFRTIQVSEELGLNYPAAASNLISWMFAKPLQFAPGANSVYSNFGYGVLGRVIEKASGKSYLDYLGQDVLGPFGITNIVASRSRPGDQPLREIWYDGVALGRSAVDYPTNQLARFVDGGGYYESYDAFGGLSASSLDLCRYMLHYLVGGGPRPNGGNWSWSYLFYGSLPGTTTVINQQVSASGSVTNGLEFAALLNKRTEGTSDDEHDMIRTNVLNAVNRITSWPTNGGGQIEWNVSATNVNEGAANATLRLVRTGLSTRAVQISYSTCPGTARALDYLPRSGVVSFAAGETIKDVSVPILDDILVEPVEEFYLELISAAGGAWLGDRVTAAVRIVDNDGPSGFASPLITLPPLSQTVTQGAAVTFTVSVTGPQPLSYEWRLNGTNLPDATGATYTIPAARAADAGDYIVAVGNPGGVVESPAANLLVLGPGTVGLSGLRREMYRNIPGSSFAELRASPRFPEAPDATSIVGNFELPAGAEDNFGVRLTGFVVPSSTGAHRFYLSSDDQSALWLSTDDHPANLRLIAFEPEWSNSREFIAGVNQGSRGNPPANVSAPITLLAGRRYYVEALMKEATGGNSFAVTWQTPGGAAPANGAAPIPGANLAYLSLRPIITSPPRDLSVALGGNAVFSPSVLGTPPLRFQWRRDGLNLAGATNRVLTLGGVQAGQLGGYSVVVNNTFGFATSLVAQLTFPSQSVNLQFTHLQEILSNGTYRTHLVGATGLTVRVDFSTNLPEWQTLRTYSNSAGSLLITDTNALRRPGSLYRARTAE